MLREAGCAKPHDLIRRAQGPTNEIGARSSCEGNHVPSSVSARNHKNDAGPLTEPSQNSQCNSTDKTFHRTPFIDINLFESTILKVEFAFFTTHGI